MKSARELILPASIWAVTLGAAFFVGRWSSNHERESAPARNPAITLPDIRRGPDSARIAGSAGSADKGAGLQQPVAGEPNHALIGEMRAVLEDASPVTRLPAWLRLLESARAEDMIALVAVIEEARSKGRTSAHEADALWAKWGQIDGPGALAFLQGRTGNGAEVARYRIAQGWASQDPLAVFAWIESHSEPTTVSQILSGALKGWAERDHAAATSYVLSSPSDSELRAPNIVPALAWTAWYHVGKEGVPEWFRGLANDPRADHTVRKFVFNALLNEWVSSDDVSAAAAFVAEHIDSDHCSADGVQRMVSRYASRDPSRAMTFMDALGEEWAVGNEGTIGSVVSRWISEDADGLGSWLASNPEAPTYDLVAAMYASSIQAIDSHAADKWIQTIKDPALRQQTLDSLNAASNPQ